MRILSLDGGGMRGLIEAVILEHLELQAGKSLCEMVDLVCGTSTGGIIAAGAAVGIPMKELWALYRDKGRIIFHKEFGQTVGSLGGLAGEEYPADGLESCLKDLFGDRKLSETRIEVLITSCDLDGQPVLFTRRKALKSPAYDFLLRDVTRSTAAAPTYFPPAEISAVAGDMMLHLLDGGLVANQPSICGLAEALRSAPLEQITIISLGTGFCPQSMSLSEARRCGLLNGAAGIFRLAMDGPCAATDFACAAILRDRYHRLQPVLGRPVAMDATDEDSLSLLEDAALRMCEDGEFDRALKALGL